MTQDEVRAFTPLVKACARRFTPAMLPASIDSDDLESVAWQALLEAEQTFDKSRGVPFDAWAWIRMRGAIGHEIERQRFGKRRGPMSEPGVLEDNSGHDRPVEDVAEAAAELRAVVAAYLSLPERQRLVVTGKLNGLLNAEIAAELGVHPSRVSQLSSEASSRIRNQVAA